jgi:hypothetical protein
VEILTEMKAHLLQELDGAAGKAELRVQKARNRTTKVRESGKRSMQDLRRLKDGLETVGIDVGQLLAPASPGPTGVADAAPPVVDLAPYLGANQKVPPERTWYLTLHLALTEFLQGLILECAPETLREHSGVLSSYDFDSPRSLSESVTRRVENAQLAAGEGFFSSFFPSYPLSSHSPSV